MKSIVKKSVLIIFALVISTLIFRICSITSAKHSGKKVYQINVHTFNRVESYITREYTIEEGTGCISFKDDFGFKHIICNGYTITEY